MPEDTRALDRLECILEVHLQHPLVPGIPVFLPSDLVVEVMLELRKRLDVEKLEQQEGAASILSDERVKTAVQRMYVDQETDVKHARATLTQFIEASDLSTATVFKVRELTDAAQIALFEIAELEKFRDFHIELTKALGVDINLVLPVDAQKRSLEKIRAMRDQAHIANEFADMACNGIQWLRNVEVGISTPHGALVEMESNLKRIRGLQAAAPGVKAEGDSEKDVVLMGNSNPAHEPPGINPAPDSGKAKKLEVALWWAEVYRQKAKDGKPLSGYETSSIALADEIARLTSAPLQHARTIAVHDFVSAFRDASRHDLCDLCGAGREASVHSKSAATIGDGPLEPIKFCKCGVYEWEPGTMYVHDSRGMNHTLIRCDRPALESKAEKIQADIDNAEGEEQFQP